MKKNILLGLFLMICISAFGQVSEADADKAFKIIDEANNQLAYKGDYSCTVSLVVEKPGIYNVEQTINGKVVKDNFFVRISANESNYRYTRDTLAVDVYINIETGVTGNPGGDSFDLEEATKYFAGALLVLVIIEWGLQYREQY